MKNDLAARDYKRIWTGARQLGMDRETVHGLAEQIAKRSIFSKAKNAPSLTKLTRSERWQLIQDLAAKGAFKFRPGRTEERPTSHRAGDRVQGSSLEIVTPSQQKFIEDLFIELASRNPDFGRTPYQRGFIRIIIGKDWPQKKWEAQKVIEGLKKRIKQ